MAFQILAAIGRFVGSVAKAAVKTSAKAASHTAKAAVKTTARSVADTTKSVATSPSAPAPSVAPASQAREAVSRKPDARPAKSEKSKSSIAEAIYDGLQLPRNELVETLTNKVAGWMKRLVNKLPESFAKATYKGDTENIPLTTSIYQVKDQSYMIAASDGIRDYGPQRLSQSEVKTLQNLPSDSEKQAAFRSQVAERHLSSEIEQSRNQGYSQSRSTSMRR